MSIIASIILTVIYIVYILLWFIGCSFVAFSFMEAAVYKENKKNTHVWDTILFLSLMILCLSGLITDISVGNIIDKIKGLW